MLNIIIAVFIVVLYYIVLLITMFPISVKQIIESKFKWKISISILLMVGAIVIAIVLKKESVFEIAGIVGGILFTVFLVVMEIIVWFPSVINKS